MGRTAVHIGASGLVFGYFGYLVARGWYDKRILSILIAVAVMAVFGWGILFGVLRRAGSCRGKDTYAGWWPESSWRG